MPTRGGTLPAWAAPRSAAESRATAGGYVSPEPVLLAEHARTLSSHAGPCARCSWAMLAGDRVADLADGTGTAHLGCVG